MPTLWELAQQPGFTLSKLPRTTLNSLKAQLDIFTGGSYTITNNCPLTLAAEQLTDRFKRRKASTSKFLESQVQRAWLGSINIQVHIYSKEHRLLAKQI
jgi:hypothetical protein